MSDGCSKWNLFTLGQKPRKPWRKIEIYGPWILYTFQLISSHCFMKWFFRKFIVTTVEWNSVYIGRSLDGNKKFHIWYIIQKFFNPSWVHEDEAPQKHRVPMRALKEDEKMFSWHNKMRLKCARVLNQNPSAIFSHLPGGPRMKFGDFQ